MRDGLSFTLLGSTQNAKAEKLKRIYKESPQKARVLYFSDKTGYQTKRFVIFNDVNGNFTITEFEKTIGISITNRMYSSERKNKSLIYKDGLFWLSTKGGKKNFVQVTYQGFQEFFDCWGYAQSKGDKEIEAVSIIAKKHELISRFSWLRFIEETPCLQHTALNTFVRNKLYSRNVALKFLFKAPLPTILTLVEASQNNYMSKDLIKVWREMKKVLINIENLKIELLKSHYFMDTCRMAMNVGEKVNCSWSPNRLKAEHDKWAKEITNVLFDTMDEVKLRIAQPYLDFAKRFGYKMLKTNKELFYEGMVQRHCVATYVSNVNSGYSGIYHIEGYTLELRWSDRRQIIIDGMPTRKEYEMNFGQFRGFKNADAPIELMNKIKGQLVEFNSGLTEDDRAKFKLEDEQQEKGRPADVCIQAAEGRQHRADWLQLDLFVNPYDRQPPEDVLIAEQIVDIDHEDVTGRDYGCQAQEIARVIAVNDPW